MSDRGAPSTAPLRRYLGSRKNIAGMVGALAGVGLHLAFGIDPWPLVAAGLYGVGALIGPSDPDPEQESLTDVLRREAAELVVRIRPRSPEARPGRHLGGDTLPGDTLPGGAFPAIERILDVLRVVLDRLDQVADQPADRAAAPERLAVVAEIIRVDLPVCLDTYLAGLDARTAGASRGAAAASHGRAVAELATQLDLIAGAVDRLAASVPDVDVQRAEELTRELRRRHGEPPAAG